MPCLHTYKLLPHGEKGKRYLLRKDVRRTQTMTDPRYTVGPTLLKSRPFVALIRRERRWVDLGASPEPMAGWVCKHCSGRKTPVVCMRDTRERARRTAGRLGGGGETWDVWEGEGGDGTPR